MGDFLVGLLPGHVSASFSSVRVPAADGICDSDVTDPDGSGTAVSEGEVGLVAVNGAVDGGLLGDYKVSISGHPSSRARGGIAVSHFASQVCKWVGLVKGGVRCRTASARGPPDAAGRSAKRPWAWVRLTQSAKRGREGRLIPSARSLHLAPRWLEVAGTQEGIEELPTPVGPDVQGQEVKGGGAD
ncbi:hypothetical protein CLOM_g23965 [Closterium sp. NIES-68]|nr:hypothetical protein CLOM_g23965 [Closterium sp. NIES-68]